jgi:hypothetical protein
MAMTRKDHAVRPSFPPPPRLRVGPYGVMTAVTPTRRAGGLAIFRKPPGPVSLAQIPMNPRETRSL